MTVSVLAAAKRLGERSGWTLSNLKLQKLLYLAHMFHLGTARKPLVSGHFEAWDYGPVHPELYHKAKIFGSAPVENIFHSVPDMEDGSERRLLDQTLDQLASATPAKLVAVTHWADGAWARHYQPGGRGIVIPDRDIRREYEDRARALEARRAVHA